MCLACLRVLGVASSSWWCSIRLCLLLLPVVVVVVVVTSLWARASSRRCLDEWTPLMSRETNKQ